MSTPEKNIKELRQLRKQLLELQCTLNMMRYGINSAMQQVDKALGASNKKPAPVPHPKDLSHEMRVQKYL